MLALILEQNEILSTPVILTGSYGYPAWLGYEG